MEKGPEAVVRLTTVPTGINAPIQSSGESITRRKHLDNAIIEFPGGVTDGHNWDIAIKIHDNDVSSQDVPSEDDHIHAHGYARQIRRHGQACRGVAIVLEFRQCESN